MVEFYLLFCFVLDLIAVLRGYSQQVGGLYGMTDIESVWVDYIKRKCDTCYTLSLHLLNNRN